MKRILTYLALAAMAVMTLASCSEEKKKKLITFVLMISVQLEMYLV